MTIQTFSKYFGIEKSQYELDFVDVPINRGDICLFIDPYAISKRNDSAGGWGGNFARDPKQNPADPSGGRTPYSAAGGGAERLDFFKNFA